MNVIEARDQLTELLKRVADGERIILKKGGKKVAALVPVADAERLEQLEDESDIRAARKALKQYKESPQPLGPSSCHHLLLPQSQEPRNQCLSSYSASDLACASG